MLIVLNDEYLVCLADMAIQIQWW